MFYSNNVNPQNRSWLEDQTFLAHRANDKAEQQYQSLPSWKKQKLAQNAQQNKPVDLSKQMTKSAQAAQLKAGTSKLKASGAQPFFGYNAINSRNNTAAPNAGINIATGKPHTVANLTNWQQPKNWDPESTARSKQDFREQKIADDYRAGKPVPPDSLLGTQILAQKWSERKSADQQAGYMGFTSKEAYDKAMAQAAKDERQERKQRRMTKAFGNPYAKLVPSRAMGASGQIP